MAAKDHSAILDIAAALGIAVAEDYRNGVLQNYRNLLEQAALVTAVPLPETSPEGEEFVP